MIFKGTVCRRSSADRPRQPEVAGEREVFKCNPQRVRRIMKETGWESVFCGTLNLRVADGVSDDLSAMRALFFERPEDVKHPTDQGIPKKRGGYFYYRATASVRGETQEVLVRRAGNPHDERCMELVAPVKLMDRLQIDERSEVEVAVSSASRGTPQQGTHAPEWPLPRSCGARQVAFIIPNALTFEVDRSPGAGQ